MITLPMVTTYTCPKCKRIRPGATCVLTGDAWYWCFCTSGGHRMVSKDDPRDPLVKMPKLGSAASTKYEEPVESPEATRPNAWE